MRLLEIVVLISAGVITLNAVPHGVRSHTNIKEYTVRGNEKVYCHTRPIEDACPEDHVIGPCRQNDTKVECLPCDIDDGYRTCIKVYSGTDDLSCFRPWIYCDPKEFVVLQLNPDGGCYGFTCVSSCNTSQGYIQKGRTCVLQCGVNTTVTNGTCKPCPSGTYKLSAEDENCSVIPETDLQEPIAKSTVNESDGTVLDSHTTRETTTTAGNDDKEQNQKLDPKGSTGELTIILVTVIPSLLVIIVIVLSCIFCRNKDTGLTLTCCNCCNCVCSKISGRNKEADGASISSTAERNLGHSETDPANSTPPTYRTEDPQEADRIQPEPASGDVSSHLEQEVPNPASDILPPVFVPPADDNQDEVSVHPFTNPPRDHKEETSALISRLTASSNGWPTLATKGPSSLKVKQDKPLQGDQVMEMKTLLTIENEKNEMKDEMERGLGEIEDNLSNFTLGSSLRLSSITDVTDSEKQ